MKKSSERERVIKNFTHYLISSKLRQSDRNETSTPSAKDLLSGLASWAGKGKDELLQVICKEIGTATAMVLKEPLDKLLENKKLQITIELVPNEPTQKKAFKKNNFRSENN